MEVLSRRHIKSGSWYKRFVPRPEGGDVRIKAGASVGDTLNFIPQMVRSTLEDTRQLAPRLKGKNLKATCKNIWEFVVGHIRYQKDAKGKEQVRRPARTLYDQAGDCDCMSGLVSSILYNLGLPHSLRVTKYGGKRYFQHIYVIVPRPEGGYFTIDPVVDENDYEEPYTEKKDVKMDLHYLNGPGDEDYDLSFRDAVSDTDDLPFEDLDINGLGFRRRGGRRRRGRTKKNRGPFKRRGINKINKFNPATILLRNGILAAAKMDLPRKKVRGGHRTSIWRRLKLAYLREEDAKRRGYNMANWHKMRGVLQRLHQTFHDAGGKPENLKKAILTGKANRDGEVPYRPGLGMTSESLNFGEDASLLQILGPEIYSEEFVQPQMSLSGTGDGLGEVATGAAIAAAMTVLTAIAAMVGKVGEIRDAVKGAKNGGVNPIPSKDVSVFDQTEQVPTRTSIDPFSNPDPSFPPSDNRRSSTEIEKDENDGKEKKSFGEWFGGGGWMWFAGAAAAGGIGYIAFRTFKKPKPKPKTSANLAGPPKRRKKRKRKKAASKRKHPKLKRRRKRRSQVRDKKSLPIRPVLSGPLLGNRPGLSGNWGRKLKRRKKRTKKSGSSTKKKKPTKRELVNL